MALLYVAAFLLYVLPLMLVFRKAHRSPLWAVIPIVSTLIFLLILGLAGHYVGPVARRAPPVAH